MEDGPTCADGDEDGEAQASSAAGETGFVAAIARGIAKAVRVVGPPMEAHDAHETEASRSVGGPAEWLEMVDGGVQGEGQVQEEMSRPEAMHVEVSSGMIMARAATASVARYERHKGLAEGFDDERVEKPGWGMHGLVSRVKRRLGKGAEDQRARDAEERRKHRREHLAAFLDDALGLE
jgi:hypothetical protein